MSILLFPVLLTKLALSNLKFALQVLRVKLTGYQLVALLYLLVFFQVLVVMGVVYFQQKNLDILHSTQQQDEVLKQTINLSELPEGSCSTLLLEPPQAKKLLLKHRQKLAKAPNNRELLINTAVLELKLNNRQQYTQLINRAKQVSPNWEVWDNSN